MLQNAYTTSNDSKKPISWTLGETQGKRRHGTLRDVGPHLVACSPLSGLGWPSLQFQAFKKLSILQVIARTKVTSCVARIPQMGRRCQQSFSRPKTGSPNPIWCHQFLTSASPPTRRPAATQGEPLLPCPSEDDLPKSGLRRVRPATVIRIKNRLEMPCFIQVHATPLAQGS